MAKGAAIFSGTSSVAYETGSLPGTETCTVGGWFYMANRTAGTNQAFFYINSASDIGLRMSTADTLRLSGPGTDISAAPATGAWFYLALVTQAAVGSTVYLYNAALVQQAADFNAAWSNGGTIAEIMVGNAAISGGTQGWSSSGLYVSQLRVWSAALNQAAIEAELASSTPVITGTLLESFENDPATDGWTTSGVTASTSYWPPNYTGDTTAPVLGRRIYILP